MFLLCNQFVFDPFVFEEFIPVPSFVGFSKTLSTVRTTLVKVEPRVLYKNTVSYGTVQYLCLPLCIYSTDLEPRIPTPEFQPSLRTPNSNPE